MPDHSERDPKTAPAKSTEVSDLSEPESGSVRGGVTAPSDMNIPCIRPGMVIPCVQPAKRRGT